MKKHLYQIPGKAIYVGEKAHNTTIEVTDYNLSEYRAIAIGEVSAINPFLNKEETTSWINVSGLNETQKIQSVGKLFGLHPLIIEDIVNTRQRPKIEEINDGIFIKSHLLYYDKDSGLRNEAFNMVLKGHCVITFQEAEEDVFIDLKRRIKDSLGQIRQLEADYLFYALLDVIVDGYFLAVDKITDTAEALEEKLLAENSTDKINWDIQRLKREIMEIRSTISPMKEIVKVLKNSESIYFQKKSQRYLSDLSDHITQIAEDTEVSRAIIWGLMEIYMSTVNNKMNEVMKVLTIMASIFIPLTFIAGIYGMNFENIPELKLRYGYFYVWGVILIIVAGMLWYFKRKKWL